MDHPIFTPWYIVHICMLMVVITSPWTIYFRSMLIKIKIIYTTKGLTRVYLFSFCAGWTGYAKGDLHESYQWKIMWGQPSVSGCVSIPMFNCINLWFRSKKILVIPCSVSMSGPGRNSWECSPICSRENSYISDRDININMHTHN